MKYHSDTLVPHKSAVMACPANLLAEEVCLPAALVKKTALENNIAWMQRYAIPAASRWRRTGKRR